MSNTGELVKCRVTKQFGDYNVGDVSEFTREEVTKWSRKGRIREIKDNKVDRSKLKAIPPGVEKSGQVQMSVPKRTVGPTRRQDDKPSETPKEGPSEKPADRPAEKPDEGPTETKDVRVPIEVEHRGGGWYQVLVGGTPVKDDAGEPRSLRKDDAKALAAKLGEAA